MVCEKAKANLPFSLSKIVANVLADGRPDIAIIDD